MNLTGHARALACLVGAVTVYGLAWEAAVFAQASTHGCGRPPGHGLYAAPCGQPPR